VVRQAPVRATDSKRVRRTDMVVENPGISSVVARVWRVEGAQTVKQTSYFIGLNIKHQALSCICAGMTRQSVQQDG
jgi:hypothetical protein